jgi:hypothetical protein
MKSPVMKLAAAAIVTIAFVIGGMLWRGTGSGIALAEVVAQVEQIKALRYNLSFRMTYPGSDPNISGPDLQFTYTTWASEECGWKEIGRNTAPDGGDGSVFQERYFLPQKRLFILINRAQKTYLRRELDDTGIENIKKQTTASNPLINLKKLMKTSYEILGRSTIDGLEVEGFRSTDPNLSVGRIPENAEHLRVDNTIWVDVKTRLPVRYDYLTRLAFAVDDGPERINAVYHSVTDDFQWGIQIAAAELEPPPVPDGYELIDRRLSGKQAGDRRE